MTNTRYTQLSDSELMDLKADLEALRSEAGWWEWVYYLMGFEDDYRMTSAYINELVVWYEEALMEIENRVNEVYASLYWAQEA